MRWLALAVVIVGGYICVYDPPDQGQAAATAYEQGYDDGLKAAPKAKTNRYNGW